MKILFHTSFFDFHSQYGYDIKKEAENRGYIFTFTPVAKTHSDVPMIENICSEKYKDYDFTILPDESCKSIAGKGVYINHGIFVPQLCHYQGKSDYETKFRNNVDYFFMPSEEIANAYKTVFIINKPIKITGFPQLDNIYNKRINKIFNKKNPSIIYVPTGSWKKELNSEKIVDNIDFKKLGYQYKKLGHPSQEDNNSTNYLYDADIIISDYSSIGLHAIACNIPTILVDNEDWNTKNPDNNSISVQCREASIRVVNEIQLIEGIKTYVNNPIFLEEKRKEYGPKLSKYIGNSSKIFVDNLENILQSYKSKS